MVAEIFCDSGWTIKQLETAISEAIHKMALDRSNEGKMCVLYVLPQTKSLRTGKWGFRGFSASPALILQRVQLWLPVRSLACCASCKPRYSTISRMPMLRGWLGGSALWQTKAHRASPKLTVKSNLIISAPSVLASHFVTPPNGYKKRRWRQHALHWFIHRDTPKLDRAGIASADLAPGPQKVDRSPPF